MKKAAPLVALVVALAFGVWLLASDPPPGQRPAPATGTQGTALAAGPTPSTAPALLSDGAAYTPLFYANAQLAVGTAEATDGSERLIVRGPAGEHELRRQPKDAFAQFLGLTAADGALYWAESAARPDGGYETRLWRAPLDGSAPPVPLTADTGAAVFFDSEYDLVVADGRVHWVAAAPDDTPRTELRSVAVTGGTVSVQTFDGRFRHTTWPWLLSVDDQAPTVLANPADGTRRTVTRAAGEQLVCTPAWCRSMITAAADRNLFDVLHPDGSARRRLPGNLTAVTVDTAVAGRYEIFLETVGDTVRLVAYDAQTSTMRFLAANVGVVTARAGLVWWADSPSGATSWNAVDLRQ